MMLYKNTKKNFAHRIDPNFFEIVTGVPQGDTLAYGIQISSSLKISNKNILKNILEI